MNSLFGFLTKDIYLTLSIAFLLTISLVILNSIAPSLFPLYFVYIVAAVLIFWFFSQIDFEVISLFSTHLYVVSIVLLLITLLIGRVTRGTIRWIPIGPISLQPAEIIRPFLLLFFANYLTSGKFTIKKIFKIALLAGLPVVLILVQPSLGVSILTIVGFLGVLLASNFNKKYVLAGFAVALLAIPIFWQVMAPYQKQRVMTFLEPARDPLGSGYNSLQSVIAAGSGGFFGRGLGRGIQTQLSFLPEKQTDFIFAAISEEMGLTGDILVLLATFIVLFRLTKYMDNSISPAGRAYLSGFFLVYLLQVFVHVGMNMGMLPVTGIPFPLVSAGGSSLMATILGLGIAAGASKR